MCLSKITNRNPKAQGKGWKVFNHWMGTMTEEPHYSGNTSLQLTLGPLVSGSGNKTSGSMVETGYALMLTIKYTHSGGIFT